MWFWEVIYKDADGTRYAVRSSVAFEGAGEAFLAYQAVHHSMGEAVEKLGGVLILQEHIIYVSDFPKAVRDYPL